MATSCPPPTCRGMLALSGADGVMIGRGAYGAPVAARVRSRPSLRPALPSPRRAGAALARSRASAHYEAMLGHYGLRRRRCRPRASISAGISTAGSATAAVPAPGGPDRDAGAVRGCVTLLAAAFGRRRGRGRRHERRRAVRERAAGGAARRAAACRCCWSTRTARSSRPTPPRETLLPGVDQRAPPPSARRISCPFGSPLLALIEQVRERGAPVNEYRVDVGTPRNGGERVVDIYARPSLDLPAGVVVVLQERSMADKIDRQLTHRGAARTRHRPGRRCWRTRSRTRCPASAARRSCWKSSVPTRTAR